MAKNPINLAVRFFLELAGLYFIGRWGWTQHYGIWRYLLGIGLPILAAFIWGTFRVPGDGGAPKVRIAGVVRLLIETLYFGFAAWTLFASGAIPTGWIVTGITLLHYIISYDRILWLLKQ